MPHLKPKYVPTDVKGVLWAWLHITAGPASAWEVIMRIGVIPVTREESEWRGFGKKQDTKRPLQELSGKPSYQKSS